MVEHGLQGRYVSEGRKVRVALKVAIGDREYAF